MPSPLVPIRNSGEVTQLQTPENLTNRTSLEQRTHQATQELFHAKASQGIPYSRADRAQQMMLKIAKWLLCVFTIPIDQVFKKIAQRAAMANEDSKKINQWQLGELRLLEGKEFYFEAEDGTKLEGMNFKTKIGSPHKKTILVCSGSHLSQEQYNVPIVKALLALGHDVMTFNYRGFGNSEGEASEEGLYMDGEAAYQYLGKQGIQDKELVFYGYSLGGAVATELAARHEVTLFLDRTFSSGTDQAEEGRPIGLGWLARLVAFSGCHFDNAHKLQYVKKKTFIYQEEQDNRHLTFLTRMQNAFSKARGQSIKELESSGSLITAHGGDNHFHNDFSLWFRSDSDSEAKRKLQKFLDE